MAHKERHLEEREAELTLIIVDQERKLQEVSGLTAEEARQQLFADIESRTRHEAARMVRVIETEAKEAGDRKAKEILATAIQRYAGDFVAEQTVTAVTLPSEDMKGRIIGREGRNIRALEAATGVDLIIDDTPETVILSAYSPFAPPGGQDGAGAAHQRWPHPSRPHRGHRQEGGAGTRGQDARGG